LFDAFNAQAKSIGDLLSDIQPAKIVVPRFQRGYSWEKKHVEAFWNDVRTFRKEKSQKNGPDRYFLGPIVIMSKLESKDVIYLLDGQQRLATTTILLSVLRDIADELNFADAEAFAQDVQNHLISKEDVGYSLELGELDKTYFMEAIQAYPPTPKAPTLRSHRNIQKAREILLAFVKNAVASLNPTEALIELKGIRKTLKTELIMAAIPVQSERDAFRIFETLNDRGLRLSVPDLLLNYLMGNAESDESRAQVREYWNEMIQAMGKRDINRFLRHMWVSKYGDLKNIDLFTALKTHITEKDIKALDFAKSCAAECERYVELWNASDAHLGSAAKYIRTLVRELEVESAMPVLLSAYSSFKSTDLETITKWILVFITRYSIIAGLDSSGMESIFFALARDIRTKMANQANGKACLAIIKSTLTKAAPSDEQVKAALQKLILEPETASYVLTRLAVRMQTGTKEIKLDESNLEHVFPKKPSNEWKNKEQLEPVLWHLGNLTMLGERLNSGAASKGYDFKRKQYEKSELVMARKMAETYKTWNEAAIQERAQGLGPLINEIWNFDNPSRV
jgi:hypothetical protein